MDTPKDPTEIDMVLTPKERDALLVDQLPRGARGDVDRACGSTPQQRWNAKRRAQRKLDKMRREAGGDAKP